MKENDVRDRITVQDEDGNEKDFAVEALFDMEEESFALLASDDENLVLMRVVEGDEGDEQVLVGIEDAEEAQAILDAYQVAVDAAPAERETP